MCQLLAAAAYPLDIENTNKDNGAVEGERMDKLAEELNGILSGTAAGEMLSDLGKRMFFPKGIIAQSAEAKGADVNGTIGMTVIAGETAILPSIHDAMRDFAPHEIVAYAPTAGSAKLRELWKDQMLKKNPLLKDKNTSLPAVTPGLTAGISYVADLFIDGTRPLLAPNPSWDNYSLIVEARRGAEFHQFNMFKKAKDKYVFDADALKNAIDTEAKNSGSVRLLLNFPQNPSGYSPSHSEAMQIVSIINDAAARGTKILVLCDDAYFGLAYESDVEAQSLFAYLADINENVLAIKADGPTKEDFAWGFRCGFLTFAGKGLSQLQYDALVKKLMGIIRSSVSCSSTPTQSILIHEFTSPKHEAEKSALKSVLQKRYSLVRDFVDTHKSSVLTPLPFNSGYFMSFNTNGIDAEVLRQRLLRRKIGTIAIDSSTLRIAFSSIDEDKITETYRTIYEECDR